MAVTQPHAMEIIDSQSVKTIYASEDRSIEGRKNVKGRKRHIVVDKMGDLLSVVVYAADINDTKVGIDPSCEAHFRYPTIEAFCGNGGYEDVCERCL